MKTLKILTKSAEETKKIGKALANQIVRNRASNKGAVVVSLEGELGSGKTTFTQGFAKGLGVKENPRSPTFVIIKIHPIHFHNPPSPPYLKGGIKMKFSNFIHIDAYRIKSKDLKSLGWKELTKNKENIILIEWGNRVKSILPKNTLRIIFKHGKSADERSIKFMKKNREH